DQAAVGNRYARSGRRRSWNQRATPLTQCCLHVDASSLSAGAPHPTPSSRLYAISRSPARSTTSFSTSVQAESSLHVYENLRDKSSDPSTLFSSASRPRRSSSPSASRIVRAPTRFRTPGALG